MRRMDRRAFLRTGVGAMGAIALASCTTTREESPEAGRAVDPSRPAPRPTIRASVALDFGLPQPFNYLGAPGYQLMTLVYDTLLQEDVDGKMLLLLASRYQRSPDGLVYTFELRDNVRWQDGRPLTVDDVKFTFDYFRSQTLASQLVAVPRDVAEVRVVDPRTVEVRLEKPAVTFPRNVAALLPIVPRHVWAAIPNAAEASRPEVVMGSGPYRLQSYTSGEGAYLFVANDDYHLGKPFVKRVEMRPVGDDLTALQAGEIDVGSTDVFGVPPETLAPFRADRAFGVQEFKSAIAIPLRWNVGRGGALADVRFRQACARAIDRNDIVQRLTNGSALPGNPGYLSQTSEWHVDVEQYPHDPGLANRLLDEAGYARSGSGLRQGPDGRPLRFSLTVVSGIPAVLELVVAAMKGIGVEVVPKQVPLINVLGDEDYEMLVGFDGDLSGKSDPDHLRLVYSSRSDVFQHPKGYANPQMDQLLERQVVTIDDAERRRLVAEIQQIAARDLPVLPLYYPTTYSIFRRQAFDQWGEGLSLTEQRRNLMTGLKSGITIRPGT